MIWLVDTSALRATFVSSRTPVTGALVTAPHVFKRSGLIQCARPQVGLSVLPVFGIGSQQL